MAQGRKSDREAENPINDDPGDVNLLEKEASNYEVEGRDGVQGEDGEGK